MSHRPDENASGETVVASKVAPISASETRDAYGKLVLAIGGISALAIATHTWKTVAVVFVIVGMIMVHELGHFLTAKRAGMKVTEFFLGFGPRLWSVKRGETEYGIKGLPFGGYVKIIGMANIEEVAPEDEPRTYRQKPFRAKLAVALAGSFMHFIMAYLILVALLAFVGFEQRTNEVGNVNLGRDVPSPAQAAGMQAGDKITSIDGRPVKRWTDIPKNVKDKAGEPVAITVERSGEPLTFTVTPVDGSEFVFAGASKAIYTTKTGVIGVGASSHTQVMRQSLVTAVPGAAKQIGSAMITVVQAIGERFSPTGIETYFQQLAETKPTNIGGETPTTVATTAPVAPGAQTAPQQASNDIEEDRFLSPVGLVKIVNDAANAGLRDVLILLLSFNVFIGIFNLIPLLPFDGGHVAIATYERIRSRKGRRHMVDFAKLLPLSYCVLMILAFITLSAMYLDIFDPVSNQFE